MRRDCPGGVYAIIIIITTRTYSTYTLIMIQCCSWTIELMDSLYDSMVDNDGCSC